jgi:hypothetical protein
LVSAIPHKVLSRHLTLHFFSQGTPLRRLNMRKFPAHGMAAV